MSNETESSEEQVALFAATAYSLIADAQRSGAFTHDPMMDQAVKVFLSTAPERVKGEAQVILDLAGNPQSLAYAMKTPGALPQLRKERER